MYPLKWRSTQIMTLYNQSLLTLDTIKRGAMLQPGPFSTLPHIQQSILTVPSSLACTTTLLQIKLSCFSCKFLWAFIFKVLAKKPRTWRHLTQIVTTSNMPTLLWMLVQPEHLSEPFQSATLFFNLHLCERTWKYLSTIVWKFVYVWYVCERDVCL